MNERLVSMALGGLDDAPTMDQIRNVAEVVITAKGTLFPEDQTTVAELVRTLEERWPRLGSIRRAFPRRPEGPC